ncbi:MAG: Rv0909 family putative TA system antitoxin [Actinomycetaceae bacterium]|nr:Rv0909 family putative TA system antitoxin [Actinomycetaceae bacterium]
MNLDDLKNKATEAVKDATSEENTDKVLDAVADAASKVTGGKLDDKIQAARDFVDEKIGD